jgi:hypothetical protein
VRRETWFWRPSVHVAATVHALLEQAPLWQSPEAPHALAAGHEGQLPPQSTSVSSPFWEASEHDAGAATHASAEHVAEAQSLAAPQAAPREQTGHSPPPQSIADSTPLSTPSLQRGALGAADAAQTLLAQLVL